MPTTGARKPDPLEGLRQIRYLARAVLKDIEGLEAAVEGMMTSGSAGQPAVHPAAAEARAGRLAIDRLLGKIPTPPPRARKPTERRKARRPYRRKVTAEPPPTCAGCERQGLQASASGLCGCCEEDARAALDRRAEARRLLSRGIKAIEISRLFGVSPSTVHRWTIPGAEERSRRMSRAWKERNRERARRQEYSYKLARGRRLPPPQAAAPCPCPSSVVDDDGICVLCGRFISTALQEVAS